MFLRAGGGGGNKDYFDQSRFSIVTMCSVHFHLSVQTFMDALVR